MEVAASKLELRTTTESRQPSDNGPARVRQEFSKTRQPLTSGGSIAMSRTLCGQYSLGMCGYIDQAFNERGSDSVSLFTWNEERVNKLDMYVHRSWARLMRRVREVRRGKGVGGSGQTVVVRNFDPIQRAGLGGNRRLV